MVGGFRTGINTVEDRGETAGQRLSSKSGRPKKKKSRIYKVHDFSDKGIDIKQGKTNDGNGTGDGPEKNLLSRRVRRGKRTLRKKWTLVWRISGFAKV